MDVVIADPGIPIKSLRTLLIEELSGFVGLKWASLITFVVFGLYTGILLLDKDVLAMARFGKGVGGATNGTSETLITSKALLRILYSS